MSPQSTIFLCFNSWPEFLLISVCSAVAEVSPDPSPAQTSPYQFPPVLLPGTQSNHHCLPPLIEFILGLLISVVISHQTGSQRSLPAGLLTLGWVLSHLIQLPLWLRAHCRNDSVWCLRLGYDIQRAFHLSLFNCSLWGNAATIPLWEELRSPSSKHHQVGEPFFWKQTLQPQWSLHLTAAEWENQSAKPPCSFCTTDARIRRVYHFKPLSVEVICCHW